MQLALVVILLQVATQAASWSEPPWELIQAPPWSPLAFDLQLLATPQQGSLNEMKPAFSHCRQFFYMTADATHEANVCFALGDSSRVRVRSLLLHTLLVASLFITVLFLNSMRWSYPSFWTPAATWSRGDPSFTRALLGTAGLELCGDSQR